MQMGRNSDVNYRGLTVHIQTEDLGLSARKAMAQIFYSGQIIESRSMSYAAHIESIASEQARDEFIRKFLDGLHRDCYKRLQSGAYDARLPIREEQHTAPPSDPNVPLLDVDDIPVELDAAESGLGRTAGWQAVGTGLLPVVSEAPRGLLHPPAGVPAFRGWGSDASRVEHALAGLLAQFVVR